MGLLFVVPMSPTGFDLAYAAWGAVHGPNGMRNMCNMCADLRAIDQNPACVDACPLRALDYHAAQ